MKNLFFLIAFLFISTLSFSQVSVKGYYRSNGTYVKAHQRTAPNHTRNDNYSTIGNINPYTGKAGTKSRDSYSTTSTYTTPSYSRSTRRSSSSYSTPTYSAPTNTYGSSYATPTYTTTSYSTPTYNTSRTIYTGPRGGTYYINSNGNKTYVR